MKTPCMIQYVFTILLTLLAIASADALESTQTAEDVAALNSIATNALLVLRSVPFIGLEDSISGIEQIIENHRRLSRESGVAQQQLSLVLADAVAYAIVTEVYRAETVRLGVDPNMTPKSIPPFDKKTAVRLWRTNVPDFPAMIRKALQRDDVVTGFVAKHSSEADVLSGEMIDKAPLETIEPRIRELHEKAMHPVAFGAQPSPDEQLVYALIKYQAFRDLGIIMDLYEKGDLPYDSAMRKSAIEAVLKDHSERRVDDGMKVSAFKVWGTFTAYFPDSNPSQDPVEPMVEYRDRQAFALGPFMTDTSLLPEIAKLVLLKMDGRRVLPPSK